MAELIQRDDSLNKGREKLNEAIKASDRSEVKSDTALSTANTAKSTADITREEMQEIIREQTNGGDIVPEVVQARGGEDSLSSRLNSVDADLAQKANQDDLNEINSQLPDIKSDLGYNTRRLEYREKQIIYLSEVYRKIKKDMPFTITVKGDSLTYGEDVVSSDRRGPDSKPTTDGSVHKNDRASVTYPEALASHLNSIYNNRITVSNHGFSGDRTVRAYTRWGASLSDVCIMMFGTNDANPANNVSIETFIDGYKSLIERELDNGTAVILLSPPKKKDTSSSGDTYLDAESVVAYGNAVLALGDEYSIPVVDMTELLSNYAADIYVDNTHFNGKGYNIIGARLASVFVGEGLYNIRKAYDGTTLSVRPSIDSIYYGDSTSFAQNAGYPTPNEITLGQGIASTVRDGGSIIYSFYAEQEDLVVVPTIYTSADSEATLSLDFGTEIPDTTIDYALGHQSPLHNFRPPNPIKLTRGDGNFPETSRNVYSLEGIDDITSTKYIHITTKGWHTLKISNKNGSIAVHGLQFISFDSLRAKSAQTKHYLKSSMSTFQDLILGTSEQKVKFDVVDMQSRGFSVNGNDYVIPKTGLYSIQSKISVVNRSGNTLENIRVNAYILSGGSYVDWNKSSVSIKSFDRTDLLVFSIAKLNKGDRISISVDTNTPEQLRIDPESDFIIYQIS